MQVPVRRPLAAGAVLALGALGTALATPATAASPGTAEGRIPGAWIVTLEEGVAPGRVADDHRQRHGAQVDHVYRYAVRGYAARMSAQAAARVAEDPRVASVQPDRVVTAFPKPGGGGGGGTQPEQSLPTGIDRIDGELSSAVAGDGSGSVDVDVAVIDTGIDLQHGDLDVVGGKNCARGKTYDDGNGHGTHVAGTVGALDNAIGVVGVAPGARLWAVRVLDNNGRGSWSGVICGVDWVTAKKDTIEVANMSLGGSGSEPTGSGCSTGDALHDASAPPSKPGSRMWWRQATPAPMPRGPSPPRTTR